jgi:hypothetical protein
MAPKRRYKIEANKDTWQFLWQAAERSYHLATNPTAMSQPPELSDDPTEGTTALLCAAQAFEGFVNAVGSAKCPEHWWGAVDRLPVKEKLQLMAKDLAIEIDFGSAPFDRWRRIHDFRNAMSHPRRATSQEQVFELDADELPRPVHKLVKVPWEIECTSPELEKNFQALRDMIKELSFKSKYSAPPMELGAAEELRHDG